jgi:hypothetical protein
VPREREAHPESVGQRGIAAELRHYRGRKNQPQKLRGRILRPLSDFVLSFLSASFSFSPSFWLPLVLFSLPFFMENLQRCFVATS